MKFRRSFLLVFLFSTGLLASFPALSQSLEDLQKAYQSASQDSVRLQLLSDMHWVVLPTSPQKAHGFALEEIKLAEKANLPKWVAQGYNDLGIAQQRENQFRMAIQSHNKALAIRQKMGNPDAIGSSLSKIGVCYSEIDSLEKALTIQLKALIEFRKSGNKRSIAYTLNNLSYIYQELKQFSQLRILVKEAYALNTELKDAYGILGSLNYLASLDESEGKYDSALIKYKEALVLSNQIKSPTDEASFLNNIGTIYSRKNDLKQALVYYGQALKLVEAEKDYNSIILYRGNIGNVYFRMRDLKKAEEFLRSSLALSEHKNLKLHRPQIFRTLGNLFTVKNEVDSATKYFDANTLAIQEAFSDKMAKQVTNLQTQYEIDLREQQKKILNQEIQIKEGDLFRFRWLSLFLVFGLVLLGAVFLLWRNRQKLLQQKQLDAERLGQQEIRTRAILEAEEKERTRIAKELHDGLGQQLSAAKMNLSSLQTRMGAGDLDQLQLVENAAALVDDAVKEVRTVSHQMMANALIKNGLASAVRDFVQRLGTSGSIRTELEIIDLNDRLEPAIELMLYRVLQELVTNIIRHAKATVVNIQLIHHDDSILLQVEDNGIGFDLNGDQPAGIGLTNIRSRVELLKGSFFIDSQPGHGTTSTVEVPLAGAK